MSDIVEQARAYLASTRDACAYVEDCVSAEAREWIERLCEQNEALLAREAGCIRAMGKVMEQNTANAAEVERLRRARAEWCDNADGVMIEHMTKQRDMLAEVERLRAIAMSLSAGDLLKLPVEKRGPFLALHAEGLADWYAEEANRD